MTVTAQPGTLEQALVRINAVLAELAEGSGERDLMHEHPYEQVRALADAGLGRLRTPRESGGLGVDLPTLFEVLAEVGRADSNVTQIFRGHFTTVEILRNAPGSERAAHWLRRTAAGAVFGNAQSEAAVGPGFPNSTQIRELDGRLVVSGTKYYSTGSRFADYIRVSADDEAGATRFAVVSARHPGVTHVDDWDGVGQRLTGSGTTHFDDVPVEQHGDLGDAAGGYRGIEAFMQLVHLANLAGIARRLLDDTVAMVRTRRRTNVHALADTAANDPEVLGVVGMLHARALTADTLLARVAGALQAADESGGEEAHALAYVETSAAQVAMVEAVLDAAAIAFNAGGSSAVRLREHLDRHWRNARTLASHNPVIYKPRVVGDYLVNGTLPIPDFFGPVEPAAAAADGRAR